MWKSRLAYPYTPKAVVVRGTVSIKVLESFWPVREEKYNSCTVLLVQVEKLGARECVIGIAAEKRKDSSIHLTVRRRPDKSGSVMRRNYRSAFKEDAGKSSPIKHLPTDAFNTNNLYNVGTYDFIIKRSVDKVECILKAALWVCICIISVSSRAMHKITIVGVWK